MNPVTNQTMEKRGASFLDKIAESPRKKEVVKHLFYGSSATLREISLFLEITYPTAAKLVEELQQDGIVQMLEESRSSGGRRSAQFVLNPHAGYLVVIDAGRLNTKLAIINPQREILSRRHFRSKVFKEDLGFIPLLEENISDMLSELKISRNEILGMGVGIPGFVDAENGISYSFLNFYEKSIRETLEESFEFPVIIANDMTMMTHGENHFGQARDHKNALIINLGWGIGMGFILDSKVYAGEDGFAGEFGHIQVDPKGEACHCGKVGCLETVASGQAIAKTAIQRLKDGEKSLLAYDYADDLTKITARKIVNVAKEGDEFSIHLLEESGDAIGQCLAVVLQLLNPGLIVLGGKHSHAGKLLTNSIEKCITRYTNPKIGEKVVIEQSSLGEDSNLLGAAGLIIEKIVCA